MKPFEEVWEFTDKIPGSFQQISGVMLYFYAVQSPGLMVEIGVDQGRSASILLAAAAQTGARVILIDSWESVLIDNKYKVQKLCDSFPGSKTVIVHGKSEWAEKLWMDGEADLIHIDANHCDDNPDKDCSLWLPKLKSKGIACFHDYDSSFHAVKVAVDKHTEEWEDLGVYESLAIRRKP